MRQTALLVFAAMLIAASDAIAQGRGGGAGAGQTGEAQPLVRTSSVAGQVIDADSGQPIGGAVVRLQSRLLAAAMPAAGRGATPQGAAPGAEQVLTDSDGRFVFRNLPKGATNITATAAGYLTRPSSGAPPRPLQLEDDQQLTDYKVRLLKGASVSGVVLDEAGEPAVGVAVRAMQRTYPAGAPQYSLGASATTDDRGVYRLDSLPPGAFYILTPQSQTTVPVAEGERMNIGAAMVNPMIEALTGGTQSLGPPNIRVGDQLVRAGAGLGVSGGAGLIPPPPSNGRLAAYQTSFYPGVPQAAQAMLITLKSGEDRAGVDFQIRPTASARVSGVLQGANGPAAGTSLKLVPAPGGVKEELLAVGTSLTAADGSFVFVGVPTGEYLLMGQQGARGMPNLPPEAMANISPELLTMMQSRQQGGDAAFVEAPVSVGDRDVTGLAVALRMGAKVSGSVVFNGATPPPPQQMQNIQIQFTRTVSNSLGAQQTKVNADGTFKTGGYAPGLYTPNAVGVPGPWMLRSVTVGGREALATGIEIGENDLAEVVLTFSDRASSITGAIQPEGSGTLPNATVVLVAAGYAASITAGASPRQGVAVVQPNGSYTHARLAPGDYFVLALVDDAVPVDRDPAFFDAVARLGTRVSVGEGESKVQNLKLVRSIR